MPRLAILFLALGLAACQTDPASLEPESAAPETVLPTSTILVDYEGRLDDGTVFDSGENVEFQVPRLISGMQDGLTGMRAGESKTLVIPPEKGYGAAGGGPIPPNATLTFDVTVHEILR